MNKCAATLILASIVILAGLAFFLEKDDTAHTPVAIGVMAFDSSRVHHILEEYAELIGRRGAGPLGVKTGKLVFPSPLSASCFFSPLQAAEEKIEGFSFLTADVEFTDCLVCVEELLYGVLFGKYFAAGIDKERFQMAASEGLVDKAEFRILVRGKRVPDTVLLASKPISPRRLVRFKDILIDANSRMPVSLKRDLSRMGIAGFIPCDSESLKGVERMLESGNYPAKDYHP